MQTPDRKAPGEQMNLNLGVISPLVGSGADWSPLQRSFGREAGFPRDKLAAYRSANKQG